MTDERIEQARKELYWALQGARSHMQGVREAAEAFAKYDALITEAISTERDEALARLQAATRVIANEASSWHTALHNLNARNYGPLEPTWNVNRATATRHYEMLRAAEGEALEGREDTADESFLAGMARGNDVREAQLRAAEASRDALLTAANDLSRFAAHGPYCASYHGLADNEAPTNDHPACDCGLRNALAALVPSELAPSETSKDGA